jgi:HD-GYP domain-containing protein (c-di-GMP phosphodiesterase class II)
MRKDSETNVTEEFRIMIIDDEEGILESVQALLTRNGYWCRGFTNPLEGLDEILKEHYDLLVLDYFMEPINGEMVVEKIRKTNSELYILLLTGHKDLAPPLATIKSLDIQAYCEKNDKLDQLQLLIESGIKSISQMRTIKKFRDDLRSILRSAPRIYHLQPISSILEEILMQLPIANNVDSFILVDDIPNIEQPGNESEKKIIYKGTGRYNVNIEEFPELLDIDLMESIGRARTTMEAVDYRDGVIVPLVDEYSAAIGAVYVNGLDLEGGTELLQIYAQQAASSINNAFLHSLVSIKNKELNRTYAQLKERYIDTIQVLRLAVEAKDVYTRGHSDRVAFFAMKMGRKFGLPEEELEFLRIAGIFHDVGKIGISDEILLKKEKLSAPEYEEVKKHPIKGAFILSAVSMFQGIVPIVRHHHERFDGKGYPDGLKKDEISLPACIIAVADAFDAMMSDRHYRKHLSFEETRRQLITGSGSQFNPKVVDVFLKILSEDEELQNVINSIPHDLQKNVVNE